MARSKSVAARKHREIKKQARGFKHARRKRVKNAKESLLHAGQYAYIGRKLRKRDIKKLWIMRLNAAARQHGLSYNQLMAGLKQAKIEINRKFLSEVAISDPNGFKEILKTAGFKNS